MIKPLAKSVAAAAVIAGAGLLSVSAHAASASATTSITGITTELLTLSDDFYLSDASTPYDSGFDANFTLTTYNFNYTAPNGDTSSASIGDSDIETFAAAYNNGSGSATVQWTFNWTATGTGTASLDLAYLYSVTVADYQAGETAFASSSLQLGLDGTDNLQEAFFYFNNENGNDFDLPDLVMNFDVTEGQTGSITVTMASNAAVSAPTVPLPAALPLLTSALFGLGAVARRRRAA